LIFRTPTLPCTELAMWRMLLACVHAYVGVELEIFRRVGSLRGVICGARTRDESSRQRDTLSASRFYAERSFEEPAVIPFGIPNTLRSPYRAL
jgi:hypothetical protein